MSDSPSVLVVPDVPGVTPAAPATSTPAMIWGVSGLVLVSLACVAGVRRSSRFIAPEERVFRRLVRGAGLGRREIRALRVEAARRGLASPVGLILGPATAGAIVSLAEPKPAPRAASQVGRAKAQG